MEAYGGRYCKDCSYECGLVCGYAYPSRRGVNPVVGRTLNRPWCEEAREDESLCGKSGRCYKPSLVHRMVEWLSWKLKR